MTPLEQEIENNHKAFLADWTNQVQKNWGKLSDKEQFILSYRRLSCLNALQHTVVLPSHSAASAAFFFEAQNDALVSHVNANVGSWRTALQSLRSCIENVLCSAYYREHPVELELWNAGEFRIGFQNLHKYLMQHPRLSNLTAAVSGLDDLKSEYEILSKAVHASATNFRMTDGASKVLLWSIEDAKLGQWATRERRVIEAVCSLIVCMHSTELQGAKNLQLRGMLSFVIRPGRRNGLKKELGITITPP
jgi:hypothetical protein